MVPRTRPGRGPAGPAGGDAPIRIDGAAVPSAEGAGRADVARVRLHVDGGDRDEGGSGRGKLVRADDGAVSRAIRSRLVADDRDGRNYPQNDNGRRRFQPLGQLGPVVRSKGCLPPAPGGQDLHGSSKGRRDQGRHAKQKSVEGGAPEEAGRDQGTVRLRGRWRRGDGGQGSGGRQGSGWKNGREIDIGAAPRGAAGRDEGSIVGERGEARKNVRDQEQVRGHGETREEKAGRSGQQYRHNEDAGRRIQGEDCRQREGGGGGREAGEGTGGVCAAHG
mmetsp:Transcript_33031/g.79928  ORF Transcript_33031/g.79928 Transcript_33031/m.79928 type:complete len:277 (+) Transcript_33031:213-1043(+)